MLLSAILHSFVPQRWVGTLFEWSSNARPNAKQEVLGSPVVIRNATLGDAHEIARIIVDAFDPSPEWTYMYQFKDEYPVYHLECMHNRTLEILQSKEPEFEIIAHVIDAPSNTSANTVALRPVAVAIWLVVRKGGSVTAALSKHQCQEHLDANTTRKHDFERQLTVAEHRYARSADNEQLYLALLATHPHWQDQGFGPAHCLWGQRYAQAKAINITLLATPRGYPVYKALGFEDVENVTITKIDGDGSFWLEAMRWKS